MPRTAHVHLVRHGTVDNPNHVVYVDLPGFDLSPTGVLEAHAAGRFLADAPIGRVVTSPLVRAGHTAMAIARHHDLTPKIDERLVEWDLSPRWTGRRWEDLAEVAPGEVERYLADPTRLPFASETLTSLAARMRRCVEDHATDVGPTGDVVFVSHQDPVAAAILVLTGSDLRNLRRDAPGHASVTTLTATYGRWDVIDRWSPDHTEPTVSTTLPPTDGGTTP